MHENVCPDNIHVHHFLHFGLCAVCIFMQVKEGTEDALILCLTDLDFWTTVLIVSEKNWLVVKGSQVSWHNL